MRVVEAIRVQAGEPVSAPAVDRDQAEERRSPVKIMRWSVPGGRAGMTLRQLMVSAYWGGAGLTARRRTAELMPSAPMTRS